MKRGSALIYLVGTKCKNQLKSFFKSPGKMIYLIFMALMLVLVVFSGHMSDSIPGVTYRPRTELTAGIFALFAVMFFLTAHGGFQNGGSFFRVADVNLIFPAPIPPRSVLFYGLCQQMGTSLLVGLVLIFQYSWLHQLFGIHIGELIIILLGYGLTVFLGQTVALVIYSATSGEDNLRRKVKFIYYLLLALLVAYIGVWALTADGLLAGAVDAANSLPARLFPLCGWMSWAVSGALNADLLSLVLGAVLSVAGFVLVILVMTRSRTDFYEDVLKSAEIAQSAITARKEGTLTEAAPRNVKVGKVGLGKGWGASAFYYKHMLENRRSRILLVSPTSLIFLAISLVFGIALGDEIGPVGTLAFGTYMQIFGIMLGRINKELTKPFLYLVPEPPFGKLVFALMEGLPAAVVEAVILFVPLGIIMELTPPMIVVLVVVRVSYAVLFTAGNVAVERLWGGVSSRTVVMFLYIVTLIVAVVPGVLVAVVVSLAASLSLTAGLLVLAVANLLVGALVLFLCRNMLEIAELNQT